MTRTERAEVKQSLHDVIDDWLNGVQESTAPFDCWIPDELVGLMRDAAFAVLEATENTQDWMSRKGHAVKSPALTR